MMGFIVSPFLSSLLGISSPALPPIALTVRLEDNSTAPLLARPEAAAAYAQLAGRQ